jgi:hypothetical protein
MDPANPPPLPRALLAHPQRQRAFRFAVARDTALLLGIVILTRKLLGMAQLIVLLTAQDRHSDFVTESKFISSASIYIYFVTLTLGYTLAGCFRGNSVGLRLIIDTVLVWFIGHLLFKRALGEDLTILQPLVLIGAMGLGAGISRLIPRPANP